MTNRVNWEEGKITDDAIAYMRNFIGQKAEVKPWNSQATRDAIWHFALGLGDDNPLWWDESYALKTRAKKMFAPPSFLYSCASGGRYFEKEGDDTRGGVEEFLPGCLGVWANDRWHWHRSLYLGEEVKAMGELYDVHEIPNSKFGGRSVSQTQRTVFETVSGDLLAEYYQTILRFERGGTRSQGRYAGRQKPVYSRSDQEKFAEQYALESAQRRGAKPRYGEDVEIGDSLGSLLKGPVTITNLAGWLLGWGSPMCPTNRIAADYMQKHPGAVLHDDRYGLDDTLEAAHWDPYFAEKSGFPDGYDFGCQRAAWATHLLTDWMGDDGFITTLDMRLRRPNLLGDVTWLKGLVVSKRDDKDGIFVDCTITGTNQDDETNCSGTATIKLPKRNS